MTFRHITDRLIQAMDQAGVEESHKPAILMGLAIALYRRDHGFDGATIERVVKQTLIDIGAYDGRAIH